MQDDTKKYQLGNQNMGFMGQIGPNMGQNMGFMGFMGFMDFMGRVDTLKTLHLTQVRKTWKKH